MFSNNSVIHHKKYYILKYIQMVNIIINCNNISQYVCFYCSFGQISAEQKKLEKWHLKIYIYIKKIYKKYNTVIFSITVVLL